MKLTTAQLKLLRQLPTVCVEYYKPAQKLIEFGLAERPAGLSSRLLLTEAGRAVLNKIGGEP